VGVAFLGLKVENFAFVLLINLTELVLETDHAAGEFFIDLVKVNYMLDVLFVQVLYLREQVC
jgi:hypothetical protein